MRKTIAVLASMVVIVGLSASAAFAGEYTGNGKQTAIEGHANSPCAFSGQEDLQFFEDDLDTVPKDPITKGDPAHSQSWGQIVSAAGGHLGGAAGPIETEEGPWGCNGNMFGMKK
jgi:hypothetical protein